MKKSSKPRSPPQSMTAACSTVGSEGSGSERFKSEARRGRSTLSHVMVSIVLISPASAATSALIDIGVM
jgi:hypothetical protein